MNKIMKMGGILCAALYLSACGGQASSVSDIVNAQIDAASTEQAPGESGVVLESSGRQRNNITETEAAVADDRISVAGSLEPDSSSEPDNSSALATEGIDVDLTRMSSIMVYSEVYNIMMKPEDYLGKTIKIQGPYYASYWEETGNYYHYVIIEDATACCSQGLEFIWDDNAHTFPDEYPEDYMEVEIVGTFAMYEEGGYEFFYLNTDEIIMK